LESATPLGFAGDPRSTADLPGKKIEVAGGLFLPYGPTENPDETNLIRLPRNAMILFS
jgi:hypothetical protein